MSAHPWKKSYPAPARWDAHVELSDVSKILDDAVAKYADRPALYFMGLRATYGAFAKLVDRAAAGFQKLGVKPGVHVGLYLPNTPHYPIAFFGILKAGGTIVNYSPLDAVDVLAHKVHDSDTQILVTLDVPQLAPQTDALTKIAPLRTLVLGNSTSDLGAFPKFENVGDSAAVTTEATRIAFADLLANDGTFVRYDIGDPREALAVVQYTGGTTGLPKGAMLTHANLTAATSQYGETTRVNPPLLDEGNERTILVLPLFHIYALTSVMLLSIKLGNELSLHPRFEPPAIVNDLVKNKTTVFYGVPTMYTALLNYPGIESMDFSALKYCASGGAPLPIEVEHRFRELTGCQINEGWGMTETSPSGTFTPLRGGKAGSCGIPVPGVDIRIVKVGDPESTVPPGERGEIAIKGPNVMKGYWKNPEATKESFTSDAYFRTGDVAYIDSDGYLFIVDRIKDMLLCGGFNVYPRNIEEAIYTHPSVAEVCVIGVKDTYRGETPKAFIVRKAEAPAFTLDELKEFLKDKLGKHEMVAQIEFRDALPKTAVGKLQKTVLVAEEAAKSKGETANVGA